VPPILFALAALLSQADIPDVVPQGDTIRVSFNAPSGSLALSAEFTGRSVRLFPQPDGGYLGLMPVRVDQSPGVYPLVIRDHAGTELRSLRVKVEDARFPRQDIQVSTRMRTLKPLPGELEAVRGLYATVSEKRLWAEPFLRPTRDCMNSPFGVLRYHNGVYSGNFHRGMDLRSPKGRPVRAITAGTVRIAHMFRLHGGTVGLDHGQGVTSLYLHLSRIAAREGRVVRRGEIIGWVGATGFATGPHLHWGLYVNGVPVNPAQWISGIEACE
jgi:murein DD-endopeptidase MepM/ murein hydrolase activator NlpD